MSKVKGFRVGFRKIFKWVITRKESNSKSFIRLIPPSKNPNPNQGKTKLCSWFNSLKQGAKRLCFSGSGYIRVGQDPKESEPVYCVPSGHLAIYVGEKEDNACRVLVPLKYFNHSLFGGLLKEAENIYGFNHRGRIQIPCRISEFETVRTKIAAVSGGANLHLPRSWKRI